VSTYALLKQCLHRAAGCLRQCSLNQFCDNRKRHTPIQHSCGAAVKMAAFHFVPTNVVFPCVLRHWPNVGPCNGDRQPLSFHLLQGGGGVWCPCLQADKSHQIHTLCDFHQFKKGRRQLSHLQGDSTRMFRLASTVGLLVPLQPVSN